MIKLLTDNDDSNSCISSKQSDKMNEYELFLQYWNETGIVYAQCSKDEQFFESFTSDLESVKVVPFEKPDFVLLTNNKVYLFEHFQFDSSKHKKSSSLIQEEKRKKNREFNSLVDEVNQIDPTKTVHRASTFESDTTINDFYKNFERSFTKHYRKIPSYVKHCIDVLSVNNLPIEICFFVENASIVADVVYKGDEKYILSPFMFPETHALLCKSSEVQHVFYAHSDLKGTKILTYFNNNPISRDELLINPIQMDGSYTFLDWHPLEMRYNVFIPKK